MAFVCYSNIDVFVYSGAESIASQSERLLNEQLENTINCTNNARNALIGLDRGANSLGLVNLDVNALIDNRLYAVPAGAAIFVQVLYDVTSDFIGDCLGYSPVSFPSPSPSPSPTLPTPSPSMSPLPAVVEVSESQVVHAVSGHSSDEKLTLSSFLATFSTNVIFLSILALCTTAQYLHMMFSQVAT